MIWVPVKDGDLRAFGLYRRHYSASGKPKIRQFTGPGEALCLLSLEQNALFVWDVKQVRDDGQDGINCSVFRNEGHHRSSDMILEAEAWAVQKWGPTRAFTYVAPDKIASTNPGYCFKVAGWVKVGESKKGLHLLEKQLV